MAWYEWVWLSALVALGGFELWAVVTGHWRATLSHATRKLFHTKTLAAGRVVFTLVWVAFAAWFTGHIAYGWA